MVCGSQKDFISILQCGRDLYSNGDSDICARWPSSLVACMQLLKKVGYNDPRAYHICLDKSHPCLWSIMESQNELCMYCNKAATIQFHYLPLADKVRGWCSSELFCRKITPHWRDRDHWLYQSSSTSTHLKCEIWDGKRFADLSWFWDPDQKWLLPTRCVSFKTVISTYNFRGRNSIRFSVCLML